MITYGGERITLDSGAPSIHTIGVALGRIPRFCGHTKEFYPVLSHCLVVAKMMQPHEGVYGVLHDGQESLFADVPTPMKSQVARNREAKVLERIYAMTGIPYPNDEILERVHEADKIVLVAEAHVLEHPGATDQWGADFNKRAALLTRNEMLRGYESLDAEIAATRYYTAFRRYAVLAGFPLYKAA